MVGILFGIPSLRIKGLYLAVATLAAQFFFDWLFIRVKWFTNYTPSGSVNAPELRHWAATIFQQADRKIPVRADLRRRAFALPRQEPRTRQPRPAMDGDPRHGHRRRDHGHPAALRQALGVRGVVVLHRRCRRAVGVRLIWARGSRSRSTSTVQHSCCSWSSSAGWDRSSARSWARPSSCCCRSCSIRCAASRSAFGGQGSGWFRWTTPSVARSGLTFIITGCADLLSA